MNTSARFELQHDPAGRARRPPSLFDLIKVGFFAFGFPTKPPGPSTSPTVATCAAGTATTTPVPRKIFPTSSTPTRGLRASRNSRGRGGRSSSSTAPGWEAPLVPHGHYEWFIFSEVMFFAAFFGALFYARQLSLPWLAGEGGKAMTSLLHPGFKGVWPLGGIGPERLGPKGAEFEVIHAWGLPALNTALLLTSGVTLTIAHHALKDGRRGLLNLFLALTFLLGFTFLGVQGYEYVHLYGDLNLKLSTGIYGSTFFMLTGFHGAHVTVGAIMLIVMLFRAFRGHFTPGHHFAFEAAAWYWHFVDVVWLLLFVLVYWL